MKRNYLAPIFATLALSAAVATQPVWSASSGNFTYSGGASNTFAGAGAAMGANMTIQQAGAGGGQLGPVGGFFQAYGQVHGVVRFIQAILSVMTANTSIQGCPTTDTTTNFTATDSSGNSMGYNVVASSNSANVPADAKTAGLTCSMAISLGATAAAAASATAPTLFVYSLPGSTGNNSTGLVLINQLSPASMITGNKPAGSGQPPGVIPPFSGYYGWKHQSGGDFQAIGLFTMAPPPPPPAGSGMTIPAGVSTGGMTIFYKEDVTAAGVAKVAFTNNLPAGPGNVPPAVVQTMTGSGQLNIQSSSGIPEPNGAWTIGVSATSNTSGAPPAPAMAITVTFPSPGGTPTLSAGSATPPTVNQGQITMTQMTSSSGTFTGAPSSGSNTPPGLPPANLPPPPGGAGPQPSSTFTGVFGSGQLNFSATASTPLVTF